MDAGRSTLPMRPGKLLAQPMVLLAQPTGLGVDHFKAATQRGVRGALPGRDRRRYRRPAMEHAQPFDLGA
jgi:hypothetical protein